MALAAASFHIPRPAKLTTFLLPAAILAAGCGASPEPVAGGSPSIPAQVACASPPPAIGPDVVATLGADQRGGTFCFHTGDRFNVFLTVPPDGSERWSAIAATDHTVLKGLPSGALTLVRGVTAGIFAASARGTSRLDSSLPPCTATAPNCPAAQRWTVTIVVD